MRALDTEAEEALRSEVFEALGTVSMCWIPRPTSQLFDSSRALAVGDELMSKIEAALEVAYTKGHTQGFSDGYESKECS